MRYIALILLLFAASLTMPMVELEASNQTASDQPREVLSIMRALPGIQGEESVGLIVPEFQPPERTPVKTWLGPAVKTVLPDTSVSVPVALAEDEAPEPAIDDSSVVETAEMPKKVEPATSPGDLREVSAISSNDLREVAATALNVRSGPSSRFSVVGALTLGERTAVTGVAKNGWVPVRAITTELEGWVFSRYLAPLDGT